MLTAPSADIDADLVEEFLSAEIAESLNVEYKSALNQRVLETVAAMANTYGGLILVGVSEDEATHGPGPVVGVDFKDREKLVNQCLTSMQPPIPIEVIPISTKAGKPVLVVRVPLNVERPVVMEGKVWVRLDGRNAPADRARVLSLIGEGSAPGTDISPGLASPRHTFTPIAAPNERFLAIRASSRLPRSGFAPVTFIDGATRSALQTALKSSALERAVWAQMNKWSLNATTAWTENRYSSSRTVSYEMSALTMQVEVPIHCQSIVTLSSHSLGAVSDLVLYPDRSPIGNAGISIPAADITDLFRIFKACILTVSSDVPKATFPNLLGVHVWPDAGYEVVVDCAPLKLDEVLSFGSARPSHARESSQGARFRLADGTDLSEMDVVNEVCKEWITSLLLDEGIRGFEHDLDRIVAAMPP